MFNCIKRLFSRSAPVILVPSPVQSTPEIIPTPVVVSGVHNISIVDVKDATTTEMLTVGIASHYLDRILESNEFFRAVMAFKFNQNLVNGLSNKEIYDLYTKSVVAVKLQFFTGSWRQNHISKTEGFERDEFGYIKINRYFIQDAVSLVSLVLHEVGHGLNFTHPNLEQDSVPYGFNYIVEDVAKKLGLK